jgi:hypothetical protein
MIDFIRSNLVNKMSAKNNSMVNIISNNKEFFKIKLVIKK